jgi:hypothetical protein
MTLVRRFLKFREVEKTRKFVEMKHRLVMTMFAVKRYIFAEVHIPKSISDEAPVAALNTIAKLGSNSGSVFAHFTTPRFDDSIKLTSRSTSAQPVISLRMRSRACDVLSFAARSRWKA